MEKPGMFSSGGIGTNLEGDSPFPPTINMHPDTMGYYANGKVKVDFSLDGIDIEDFLVVMHTVCSVGAKYQMEYDFQRMQKEMGEDTGEEKSGRVREPRRKGLLSRLWARLRRVFWSK